MTMLLLTCCALTGSAFGKDLLDPMQSKMDKKNVVTSIGDLVILRSFEEYSGNLNSCCILSGSVQQIHWTKSMGCKGYWRDRFL